jgi:hypothetical protein
MTTQRLLLIALCTALTGCAGGKSSRPSAYSGPTVDLSNVPAQISDKNFRSQTSDYFREIEEDGDYSNWRVPPYTAYQQE